MATAADAQKVPHPPALAQWARGDGGCRFCRNLNLIPSPSPTGRGGTGRRNATDSIWRRKAQRRRIHIQRKWHLFRADREMWANNTASHHIVVVCRPAKPRVRHGSKELF